MGMKRVTLFTK